ncbi:MAG: hypothetical protein ABUK01_00095 [Leptospirales bacterium]
MEAIKEYKNDAGLLKLKVKEEEGNIVVDWEGESTDDNPAKYLEPVFNEIFADVSRNYIVNIGKLKYMNSGTMTPLITLLKRMTQGTGSFIIKYDAKIKWQELSFDALILFQTEDERINIIGE